MAASTRRGVIGETSNSARNGRKRVVDGIGDSRRRRDRSALADALDAEFGVRRERLHVIDARGRHLGRTRQQVVREGRGQRLAGRVERHLFVQRRADALRKSAVNLAVDDHRIDQLAAVFDDDVIENFDVADFRIDRDESQRGWRS